MSFSPDDASHRAQLAAEKKDQPQVSFLPLAFSLGWEGPFWIAGKVRDDGLDVVQVRLSDRCIQVVNGVPTRSGVPISLLYTLLKAH